ncbi:MAG: hypothetical protein QM742_09430 [Aquabacterium sp.]
MNIFQSWRGLAAAICLTATASAVHASPVPGQAVASLDQLNWRVVDLTPDDEVAPWVKFLDGHVYYGDDVRDREGLRMTAAPWPTGSDHFGNVWSEAVIGPDAVSATATHVGTYHYPTDFRPTPQGDIAMDRSNVIFGRPWASGDTGMQIMLGPNTALVLEGKAKVQTMAYAAYPMVTDDIMQVNLPFSVTSTASIAMRSLLGVDPGDGWLLTSQATSSFSTGQRGEYDQHSAAKDFVVTFDNRQAEASRLSLEISLVSTVQAAVVPEPATVTLTGMGLLMLAAVGRHSRCAKRLH